MRYIVSGYRRCGTGLMMRLLTELLPNNNVFFSSDLERDLTQYAAGYSPNPSGLFEIGQRSYFDLGFLKRLAASDNFIVKIFFDGLPFLPGLQGDDVYIILFMERNPEEIKRSLQLTTKYHEKINKSDITMLDVPVNVFKPYSQSAIDYVKDIVRNREDMRLFPVNFERLIDNPIGMLEGLGQFLPLRNIDRAAAIVDPELRRARCD